VPSNIKNSNLDAEIRALIEKYNKTKSNISYVHLVLKGPKNRYSLDYLYEQYAIYPVIKLGELLFLFYFAAERPRCKFCKKQHHNFIKSHIQMN
jgi:hypothetical protein